MDFYPVPLQIILVFWIGCWLKQCYVRCISDGGQQDRLVSEWKCNRLLSCSVEIVARIMLNNLHSLHSHYTLSVCSISNYLLLYVPKAIFTLPNAFSLFTHAKKGRAAHWECTLSLFIRVRHLFHSPSMLLHYAVSSVLFNQVQHGRRMFDVQSKDMITSAQHGKMLQDRPGNYNTAPSLHTPTRTQSAHFTQYWSQQSNLPSHWCPYLIEAENV